MALGQKANIEFTAPEKYPPQCKTINDRLDYLVRLANTAKRKVVLEGPWWKQDHGPLLGFMAVDGHPVVLTYESSHTYDVYTMWDPALNHHTPVTAEIAAQLLDHGYMFYRTFGPRNLNVKTVFKFSLFSVVKDLAWSLILGIGIGILGMILPIVTGIIFDMIIPNAAISALRQITIGMIALTLTSSLFFVIQSLALLRVSNSVEQSVAAAAWDRITKLPTSFFRKYTIGDLANRANGITEIYHALSGSTLTTLMSGVFSIFSFFLLFYYSHTLAWLTTAIVSVFVITSICSGLYMIRIQRQLLDIDGEITGVLRQFVDGIMTLRINGAENHAFLHWTKLFARARRLEYRATVVSNFIDIFENVFSIFAMISIFAMVNYTLLNTNFSTGNFLAFNAAYGTFLGAVLSLTNSTMSLLWIMPQYQRTKPILETQPEIDKQKHNPGQLNGKVEFNNVTFHYPDSSKNIIENVSFYVNPNEMVAIVGPSGAGKSTLLRLLLGFEKPISGVVYFGDKDLSELDLRLVRYQLGVVLQNNRLFPGNILENIIGASSLSIKDAHEAAAKIGLDRDIADMPMGIHTVISEGDGSLSGGQKQKILLARSIVHKPKILFLDEATSALDNESQAIVSESLRHLNTTRVVIAHRLSTIVNADRIYVLNNGRIAEGGTYDELMQKNGLFANLAKRQLV